MNKETAALQSTIVVVFVSCLNMVRTRTALGTKEPGPEDLKYLRATAFKRHHCKFE